MKLPAEGVTAKPMIYRLPFLGALLACVSMTVSAGTTLPPANTNLPNLADTSSGIHVAIPFDYCYDSTGGSCGDSYNGKLSTLVGKVDGVWGAREPVIGPHVATFFYVDPFIDRVTRGGIPTVGGNTAYEYYLKTGRADWLVFKGGYDSHGKRVCSVAPKIFGSNGQWSTRKVNENLAWESYTTNNNIGRVPLDISNSDVVASQTESIKSALAAGYTGVAVDSIQLINLFGGCGVFRKTSTGWAWKPVYAAKDSFADAVTRWLKTVTGQIQTAYPHADVSMNLPLPDTENDNPILPYTDFIFDERGFTTWGSESATGKAWTAVVSGIQRVQRAGKGVLINAEIKSPSDASISERGILWALANYLLIKSTRTYTYISALNPSSSTQGYGRFYDRPEYHIAVGVPVRHSGSASTAYYRVGTTSCYGREFSGGAVFVDPSSTSRCSIPLSGTYSEITGHKAGEILMKEVRRKLTLGPAAGAILLHK